MPWKFGWQTDDAGLVHAGLEGLDLPSRDAGRDITEPDDRENAKAGADRQPAAIHHQGEQIPTKERLNRATGFDLGQEYFEATRLEVFGCEGFALGLDTRDRPVGFRHGRNMPAPQVAARLVATWGTCSLPRRSEGADGGGAPIMPAHLSNEAVALVMDLAAPLAGERRQALLAAVADAVAASPVQGA